MTDHELKRQLKVAIELLSSIGQALDSRGDVGCTKLAKAPSTKNDPLEFYLSCCQFQKNSEIAGSELFLVYKQWCNDNGSLSRGRKPFLDAISQIGITDGVQGVIRGKMYTFKNLALK
ncbi:hypothetical protein QUB10_30850 [Microcoleus sp. B5-D4]|uniref:hypothetical protein n=1 Tax=unclassified Microcoleus TaxID=2642155 RepID=UPI002FD6EF79